MKKIASILMTLVLLAVGLTAWAEEKDPLRVADEGYRIDGDGWYCVNAWCKNGEDDIFGRIYYPADFDETRQYTTVLLVHGMTLNADFWHKIYAPELAKAGYVCYAFDERSGTEGGRGSYSTPTESGTSGVVETVSDANAALDFIETLDYVNKDSIYLFGNSKGSMSVQVLASQRSSEIAGMIALYGGINAGNGMVSNAEEVMEHPYDHGEVLVIWGAGDSGYSLDAALENLALYPDGALVVISKAYHGFGNQVNRPAVICAQEVVDFIDRTANGIPHEKKKESAANSDDLTAAEEGYTYTGEGYYFTVQHAVSADGVDIFGRMYYPENFDASRKYPVIIASHGGGGTADVWDKTIAPRIAQQGECLVYAIDAQSETDGGRGSYSTPLEGVEIGRNTIENYADDIEIALDYVKSLDYVDMVYLMGGSKGGAASQVAAARRSEDVFGLIIQSGGLGDDNGSMVADYAALKENPYSGGEVLFVQGVDDQQCLIARGAANMDWYELNTFVAISSTGHGFGYQNDRSTETFVDSVNEFVHRTYNHIGEETKKKK